MRRKPGSTDPPNACGHLRAISMQCTDWATDSKVYSGYQGILPVDLSAENYEALHDCKRAISSDEVHITLQLPAIHVDKRHSPNFCSHHFGQGGLWALKCGRTRLAPALWKVVCSFCFLWSEGIIFSHSGHKPCPRGGSARPGGAMGHWGP